MSDTAKCLRLSITKCRRRLLKPQSCRDKTHLFICFNFICLLCFGLNVACNNTRQNSLSSKSSEHSSSHRDEAALSTEKIQNDIQCSILASRLDESDALLLKQEQVANQASTQAKESCRSDSTVDCNFWVERASSLAKRIKELRQQQQKLLNEKAQNKCN